ncbi:PREDICTED: vacuolar amino acid transporter 1 [Nelumbo nucifera]|uniref:Vacuolar amino acid transporter 1 n=1 Tax=Nelumbo nucifera TaxID=4432 RepID=A0A1U8Q5G7_NELNU|nr:PREDICTED: vacuolar amino acid transporter 1 [Nelumbo nucifera]
MKPEEEFGMDRGLDFQTDDEENQAETIEEGQDGYESDSTISSPRPSDFAIDSYTTSWPQSYRQSMDMYTSCVTPSNVGFIGGSFTGISSSFLSSSLFKKHHSDSGSPLSKPLFDPTFWDRDEVPPASFHPRHSVASSPRYSYLELPQSRECSYAQSVLNGVNILCGVGLLSTPFAVKEGGWVTLLVLFVFGVISCYTGILLKTCLESSPGLKTYPDIGQAAFGVYGRSVIAIILYIELYVCSVEYITLMSDNLSSLFPNVEMSFAGIYLDCHHIFAIAMTILVLPTVWLRDLTGGVISTLLLVLCLLWVGAVDKVGFHPSGTALDLVNLPVAIGICGFCYAGHSVFPNIYSSMKNPSQFSSVLMASFVICFFLYSGVAVCGFLMFGESMESQFTLNLPQNFVASKVAAWTTAVNPLSKYALTMTPVALSLEELLPSAKLRTHCASIVIRTALVLSTLYVALAVPFFGFMLAFIGSFLTMLVALIFPCACYLRILRGRLNRFQIAVCIFIITVGVACSCSGTYSAIRKIADNMA